MQQLEKDYEAGKWFPGSGYVADSASSSMQTKNLVAADAKAKHNKGGVYTLYHTFRHW